MTESKTLVVSGGGGFVMANLVSHWLLSDKDARAVVIDASPLDDIARRFFAQFGERMQFIQGDVVSPATWARLPNDTAYVVHGAAVTSHSFVDKDGKHRNPEKENPSRGLEVNVLGTVQALIHARDLPALKRFVYVSTGSVYADEVPAQENDPFPLPEDGYIGPHLFYDIGKYASELITKRFVKLFAMPARIVRLASVFGPMDRTTAVRNVRNAANRIAHAAAAGRSISAAAPNAVGDYIYAPDIAIAIRRLLLAPEASLKHDVYNIAYGKPATVKDLAALAAKSSPGFKLETAPLESADIRDTDKRRTGRWGAYDIARAEKDFGWKPRPLGEAMADYIAWLKINEP